MDVESVADELYGLPPAEFTAARERHVAQARAAGDRELADRIRALRRPTLAAWASNLLVRTRPDEVRSLVTLGDGLRRARRDPDGARLRELDRRRHALVAALVREARRLTAEAGKEIGDAAREQVEATLRAALADPEAAAEWRAGRLSRALSVPAGSRGAGTAGAGHLPAALAQVAPGTGEARDPRAGPSPAGRRSGGRAQGDGSGGPVLPAAPTATRAPRGRQEAQRRRAEEEAVAARREAAAREDEVRHALDALEGAEQRAHEMDLLTEELVVRLKEAQARREAAHGAARQARARAREAEGAARRAALHAREAAERLERGR
ncbi:hypothetical protein [Streptomyces roseolilacinus]|uniref:Uncharacterized protein n=1 Tax=Streptomyces roseolilacinus TaxID=66904 RepID=A0A918B0V7_9ACTN|nr:hypothetical protein [Streptomyces roseolilacinus]GGQ08854.1 hypothetical protein GCM10010249_29130 [Streptomyces roseolilacinus]